MLFIGNQFIEATGGFLILSIISVLIAIVLVGYTYVKDVKGVKDVKDVKNVKPLLLSVGILAFTSGKSLAKAWRVTFYLI